MRSGHEVTLDSLLEEVRKNPTEAYLAELQRMDLEDEEEDDQG